MKTRTRIEYFCLGVVHIRPLLLPIIIVVVVVNVCVNVVISCFYFTHTLN